jgi:hypothetical protein
VWARKLRKSGNDMNIIKIIKFNNMAIIRVQIEGTLFPPPNAPEPRSSYISCAVELRWGAIPTIVVGTVDQKPNRTGLTMG